MGKTIIPQNGRPRVAHLKKVKAEVGAGQHRAGKLMLMLLRRRQCPLLLPKTAAAQPAVGHVPPAFWQSTSQQ